jgi:hypothetical protein
MMITFADGKTPPVVDQSRQDSIQVFQIQAIYPHSEQTHQDVCDSSGEEDEGGDVSRMFWDMGMKSFENFFICFKVEPLSLLTHEVVKERQRLETTINSLQPQIQEGLAKIEDVQHEEQILKAYETDMAMLTNKVFKYTGTLTKQRKGNLEAHTVQMTTRVIQELQRVNERLGGGRKTSHGVRVQRCSLIASNSFIKVSTSFLLKL